MSWPEKKDHPEDCTCVMPEWCSAKDYNKAIDLCFLASTQDLAEFKERVLGELGEEKIARIIELNCEDSGNYPTLKVFAKSTGRTIRRLIEKAVGK